MGFSLLMSTASTSASVLLISTVPRVHICAGTFSSYAVTRICIRGELARRVMNDNVKARRALRNESLAQLCRTCARRTFRDSARPYVFKASPCERARAATIFRADMFTPRAARKRIRESIMRRAVPRRAPSRLERVTILYTDARVLLE